MIIFLLLLFNIILILLPNNTFKLLDERNNLKQSEEEQKPDIDQIILVKERDEVLTSHLFATENASSDPEVECMFEDRKSAELICRSCRRPVCIFHRGLGNARNVKNTKTDTELCILCNHKRIKDGVVKQIKLILSFSVTSVSLFIVVYLSPPIQVLVISQLQSVFGFIVLLLLIVGMGSILALLSRTILLIVTDWKLGKLNMQIGNYSGETYELDFLIPETEGEDDTELIDPVVMNKWKEKLDDTKIEVSTFSSGSGRILDQGINFLCPNCNFPVSTEDDFCSECGLLLNQSYHV